MDDGGVGVEVVVAERLGLCPLEEAKGEMGIVHDLKDNLGKVIWVEAVGVESAEVAPARLGSQLC